MDTLIAKLSAERPVRFTWLVDAPFVTVTRAPGGGEWCLWNERTGRSLMDSPIDHRLEFLSFSRTFFERYLKEREAFPVVVNRAYEQGRSALDMLREAKP